MFRLTSSLPKTFNTSLPASTPAVPASSAPDHATDIEAALREAIETHKDDTVEMVEDAEPLPPYSGPDEERFLVVV
ncbi:hypothetical protein HDU96_002147 [Phlyctochytrium bullatum]|nr:hypothetical protein HDU96_002147 [Phlyctochytrium bullatum]